MSKYSQSQRYRGAEVAEAHGLEQAARQFGVTESTVRRWCHEFNKSWLAEGVTSEPAPLIAILADEQLADAQLATDTDTFASTSAEQETLESLSGILQRIVVGVSEGEPDGQAVFELFDLNDVVQNWNRKDVAHAQTWKRLMSTIMKLVTHSHSSVHRSSRQEVADIELHEQVGADSHLNFDADQIEEQAPHKEDIPSTQRRRYAVSAYDALLERLRHRRLGACQDEIVGFDTEIADVKLLLDEARAAEHNAPSAATFDTSVVDKVLEQARSYIAAGWCQQAHYQNPASGAAGLRSTTAAVHDASEACPDPHRYAGEAFRRLQECLPSDIGSITEWNDASGRTVEDVLAVFDRAMSSRR